jgi:YVTN family beta-propeller protein
MSTRAKWWSAILFTAAVAAGPAAAQPAPTVPVGFPGATGAPKAYVALYNESGVAVLDTGTNRLLGFIPVPPGPHGLAVTPDGSKLYVSSDEVSTVSVIDTAMDRVVASIEVGPTPSGLAISPTGHTLFVAVQGADQVVVVDTGTDQILGRVPVREPLEIAISPDARTAYVSSGQLIDTAIVILDVTRLKVVGRVALHHAPEGLSVGPDGKRLYVTTADADTLLVLDSFHGTTVARIPVGPSARRHLLAVDDHSILVARQGENDLEIVDPSTYIVRGTVGVGEAPSWVAISPDRHVAYVTNERSNDISVVDLATQTATSTIEVGNTPREIVVQPAPFPPPMGPTQSGYPNPFNPPPQPVWIVQIPF